LAGLNSVSLANFQVIGEVAVHRVEIWLVLDDYHPARVVGAGKNDLSTRDRLNLSAGCFAVDCVPILARGLDR
jgi:hypothetical protein